MVKAKKTFDQASWWGERQFETGQVGRWRIGPLSLTLQRLALEWRICSVGDSSNGDDQDGAEFSMHDEPFSDGGSCHRHVVNPTGKPVLVLPALANRPVVTRPESPFHLAPGQEVNLFVGSTLWIQLYAFRSGPLLLDIPVQRLSDTWFGPSTRHGEIAYATRTHARLDLAEVPRRSFRVSTPVKINNRGEQPLLLERLKLPIPQLSVFAAPDGRLWTEELSITCDEEMASAHLRLGKGVPSFAKGGERLNGPREAAERGVLVRALGTIFG